MHRRHLLAPALLAVLAACGGGSSPSGPAVAKGLAYTDPATGAYRLVRNAALSTDTHLVLDLWGPSGATASGVTAAFVQGGAGAVWHNVLTGDAAGTYVANGTAFNLGAGAPILKARLTGTTLMATVAEKGTASPKALDQALLRVALDLVPGVAPGTVATLTPDPARCQILLPDGTLATVAVTASSITVK